MAQSANLRFQAVDHGQDAHGRAEAIAPPEVEVGPVQVEGAVARLKCLSETNAR